MNSTSISSSRLCTEQSSKASFTLNKEETIYAMVLQASIHLSVPELTDTTMPTDETQNKLKTYMTQLESLCYHWNILKISNYRHRTKHYDDFEV